MAERVAKMVEDENLPTIERVHFLTITEVREESTDPFSQPGHVIKNLRGTTPNFKRKVGNELKKYQRGDGAETKQIEDITEVTGYDAFGVVTPPHSMEAFAKIYEVSAPHYAAINAKVANIVGLGYNLIETSKTKRLLEKQEGNEEKVKRIRQNLSEQRDELNEIIDKFNEEDTFTETLMKVYLDFEVTGNGYLEVSRKADGTIGFVGHAPAVNMRVRKDRDGFVQISANKAEFFANFGAGAPFDVSAPTDEDPRATKRVRPRVNNPIGSDSFPNEIIHIKRYSTAGGNYYGVPDIVAAQQAIAGNEFSARFNLEYFENKAVPRHLITLKGANLGAQAQADLLTFFETGLKGQHHRSLFIPLPGDDGINKVEFEIEPIETGTQDASFNNYRKANLNEILMVHRVPITKVSIADAASLAIARDADKTFKEQVCAPQQKIFEKKVNRIIKEMSESLEFKLNEMTLTDENTQSQIDERRRKTGTETANEQRIRRGLPGIKGGDELVDLNAKDKIAQAQAEATTVRERDAARSAAASDSAGESRQPKGEGRATP